ncbi:MAG: HAMP domain-containing sensor histidine kinase [Gemmatimonadota bacterium]|nr:HAMP domain-containing sensor histidine kinase [Gemmatimonadota bacterium]
MKRRGRADRLVPLAIALAVGLVLLSYVSYTWQIAQELRRDAEVFSRIYFQVVQAAASPEGLTPEGEFQLLQELYGMEIPVVQTDLVGSPTLTLNLPFEADLEDEADRARVREYVRVLDARNPPLVDEDAGFIVHYGEPAFLRRLKWVPWLQSALLLVFVAGGAWIIRTYYQAERERIWSAMARESAHQMGTPLSSLVGWLELLDVSGEPGGGTRLADAVGTEVDVRSEMRDDLRRLEKVSRRFEAIGHAPVLRPVDVPELLRGLERYFGARLPSLGGRVRLQSDLPDAGPPVLGDAVLLEWAFENLIKNALDSLAGRRGTIRVRYDGVHAGRARFLVEDDGPGVPDAVRDSLFDVGVTTKSGGWGVGLSLARRIVVDAHGGSLRLEPSERGAVFSVELPLAGDAA